MPAHFIAVFRMNRAGHPSLRRRTMAARQSSVILLAALVLTAIPRSPLAAASLSPNRVDNARCPIEFAARRLEGYVAQRIAGIH
jgi:hypothetical protein